MSTNATARVVEERREPINKQQDKPQLVVTGQYLAEQFLRADDNQLTRMGILRQLVDVADALALKGACDKMVEIAREWDIQAGIPAKLPDPKGRKNKDGSMKEVANRGPRAAQAMNTRTTIQQVWGALRYARDDMNRLGFDDKTGFQTAAMMAKKALDNVSRTWKGDKQATDVDKATKALVREQKEETAVFIDVQKNTPREVGETFDEWQQRCRDKAIDKAEEIAENKKKLAVAEACADLVKRFDDNDQFLIASALLDRLGLAYDPDSKASSGEEAQQADNETEQAENTEEEHHDA